jgi:PDZ domain/Caspase domain
MPSSFYYSGHGATDPQQGQYLDLSQGQQLSRGKLRQAILSKNPRLAVMLSDCCSNRKSLGVKEVPMAALAPSARPQGEETPLQVRCRRLLLELSGTVDINSSSYDPATKEREVAWGTDSGGLFTQAFSLLMNDPGRPPPNQSWDDIAAQLVRRTGDRYARFRKESLANPRALEDIEAEFLQKQKGQHPQTFADCVLPYLDGGIASNGPRLGIRVFNTSGGGVRVGEVHPGSPAAQRGFEVDDVILTVDDVPVAGEADFARAIDRVMPGGTVRFDVRNSKNGELLKYINVKLAR